MDDGFGWLGALFQVSVALSQQCQQSNLASKGPGVLWDIGAASVSQLDSEALLRSLPGYDTHLDEEPPHLNPACGFCFSPSLSSVVLLCGEIIKYKN